MSLIDNIDRVALASQYPTDKIIKVLSGSFDASAATDVGSPAYMKRHSISHGQSRPVFTRLKWSTDNVNWIDGGYSTREGDTDFLPTIAYSDSTNVYILTGVTTGTLYYEVICFWIDNYDNTNPLVDSYFDTTKPLAFDSRLNYHKIFTQGEEVTSGAISEDITVNHDLGYEPDCWVYIEAFSGQVWPANAGGLSNFFYYDIDNQAEVTSKVSTSDLILEYTGSATLTEPRRIFYIIYTE